MSDNDTGGISIAIASFGRPADDPTTLPAIKRRILAVWKGALTEVGRELIRAKELHPGKFVRWCEDELHISATKAEALMNICRKSATIPDIGELPLSIAVEVAPNSVPDEVVKEVIADVQSGKKVTVKQTRDKVKAAKAINREISLLPKAISPIESAADSADERKAEYAAAENGGALASFKAACDVLLPDMNAGDLAEARSYFDQKCRRISEQRRMETPTNESVINARRVH